VPGLGEEAGAALSAHPACGTSRSPARWRWAADPGRGGANAVPVTLELGGKSPQIVFADADLDAALPFLVNAGIQNAGQTCSAASRILVERPVFDEVVRRMAERYRALRSARRWTTWTSAR
jgi:aldehyde dehydrogenase (NAD+)